MHFLDGALFPENQQKLVITAAPYGPEWVPSDFPDDIAVSMKDQVQKAVDCYNAGATVLHVHVREEDGKGSKRLSKFNELLARLRDAVPDMVLQVGGSISFAPETEGQKAKWLSDDTRHSDGHGQHVADERGRADGARRHRWHLAGRARVLQCLSRDGCTGRSGLG
jgi:uncharacterized protein (DUF849 family)